MNDVWFFWIVVNYYISKGKLVEIDIKCEYLDSGKYLNIEELCKEMWYDICVSKNKWVLYACKILGCLEGYVIIDGNEYLKRFKCVLFMEKVKIRKDLFEVFKCCSNFLLFGGKN